jgi:hypothetical protein
MDWRRARNYAARDVRQEELAVTEAEWLDCDNPYVMLDHLWTVG